MRVEVLNVNRLVGTIPAFLLIEFSSKGEYMFMIKQTASCFDRARVVFSNCTGCKESSYDFSKAQILSQNIYFTRRAF